MKTILCILCLSFLIPSIQAQNTDMKELLVNKWYMDTEKMEPVIKQMISNRPEMDSMDELNKNAAIETALNKISKSTIQYKADGIVINENSKGRSEGTWRLDEKKKEITTQIGKDEKKKFRILELTKNNLHIKNKDGLDLIFYSK